MVDGKVITVASPAGQTNAVFQWVDPMQMDEDREDNTEIIDTIKWVVYDIRELVEDNDIIAAFRSLDSNCYESVKKLSQVYNEKITKLIKQWEKRNYQPVFLGRRASRGHLKHILQQCYSRAVLEPERLNQYIPFSSEVYGETSFELVAQMIHSVKLSSDDTFVDLGSGVGQVVLQVAAATEPKSCIGVERADYPAECSKNMDREFKHWMAFYGKPYTPYKLEKGDFLSEDNRERIVGASVIFANNFAFGPQVDHQLKLRFANLKEGARIVSSKAFCPLNFRITDRNLSDIGSIMHVTSLHPLQDAVSWTDKPFSYFVHTIDRSSLEKYFARLKNPQAKAIDSENRKDRRGRLMDSGKETDKGQSGTSHGESSSRGSREDDVMSESSSSSSLSESGEVSSRSTSNTTRPNRRAAATAAASLCRRKKRVAGRLRRLQNGGVPTIPNNSRQQVRKARQAELLQLDGLQMLHATTISSVASAGQANMEAHDSSLYNSRQMLDFASVYRPRELHGIQDTRKHSAEHQDYRLCQQEDVVPNALIQYLEMMKQSFMEHFSAMRAPDYRVRLEAELAKQRQRQSNLKTVIANIEETIQQQHKDGVASLKSFLRQVGIEIDSPAAFFSEARKLIKTHRNLEVRIDQLKNEVSRLQSQHTTLSRQVQQQQIDRTPIPPPPPHPIQTQQQRSTAAYISTSLEELIKQEIMRPATPPSSTNASSTGNHLHPHLIESAVVSPARCNTNLGSTIATLPMCNLPPRKRTLNEAAFHRPNGQTPMPNLQLFVLPNK